MTEEKYILGKKQTDVLCIQTHFRKRQILKTDRYILGKRQIDGKTARGKCFVCHILVGDILMTDTRTYLGRGKPVTAGKLWINYLCCSVQ